MTSTGAIFSSHARKLALIFCCDLSERRSSFSTCTHLLVIIFTCRAPKADLESWRVSATTSIAFSAAWITIPTNLKRDVFKFSGNAKFRPSAVSYTHLTLPTNREV